jgi:hypothetical protein
MNRSKPHVYIVPEDRRDEQIAIGFVSHHLVQPGRMRVMRRRRGWRDVLESLKEEYIPTLHDWSLAYVVLIVDFDGQGESRRKEFENVIPDDLKPRVFVLGASDEPEVLKRTLNLSYEEIGRTLAAECESESSNLWSHPELANNATERKRLFEAVKSFVFS